MKRGQNNPSILPKASVSKRERLDEHILHSEDQRHNNDLSPVKLPRRPQQHQQPTLEKWGFGKEVVTQNILDRKIMDYIIEEMLPFQTVDNPFFVQLVLLGLPKGVTVMSAQSLRDRIEKRATSVREWLARQMGAVEYVATTADCWMGGGKTFLEVTAHWINPTTLQREFGALACRCLMEGRLTYSVLAKALRDVYMQYGICHKVVCTTTDSGYYFVKALPDFHPKEPEDAGDVHADQNEVDNDGDGEEAKVKFVPISELLCPDIKGEKGGVDDFGLPPHQRCVSHTLTLVATQDLEALISKSSKNSPLGLFREHFSSLMAKCSKLWSKQTQSVEFAQYIHQQCGVSLKVPNKTSWDSTFEALKQLSELISTMPLKVNAITDQCSLEKFTVGESWVIQEYTEVMEPLARTLDILLQEDWMFPGCLLPTLSNLYNKLQELENKFGRNSYCLPLSKVVRRALRKRFTPLWEDQKLLLAACLHPRFKTNWFPLFQTTRTDRYMMEALIKAEINCTVDESEEGGSLEEDIFSALFQDRKSTPIDTADQEALNYLSCSSRQVTSLFTFPRVRQSFIRYNTGIPSSAAAQRLFCTHHDCVNRHRLSDALFEQLVLLKQNRAILEKEPQ